MMLENVRNLHYEKQYIGSSKKIKSRTTIQHPASGYFYQRKTKTPYSKRHMHPMFIVALFTVAKIWKQPKCPSTDDRLKMWYIYTQ